MHLNYIVPDWPAPRCVRAAVTTRHGGVSLGPYSSLNLGDHVGDGMSAVMENRAKLKAALHLPSEPLWLKQVHGCNVATIGQATSDCTADAAIATVAGDVCAVLTADCLPLLICNIHGNKVAAIHAGWRGLAAGVIEKTLQQLNVLPTELLAWMGPAIGPSAFEVGTEVRNIFIQQHPDVTFAFTPSPRNLSAWMANIYALARYRLEQQGVGFIGGGNFCTVNDAELFFSHRRDSGITGRMASIIWLD